jgi:glycogen synthase
MTDLVIMFYIDSPGKCRFVDIEPITSEIGKNHTTFLQTCINHTLKIIKRDYPWLFSSLIGKKIRSRISDTFKGTIFLTPHELILNRCLLDYTKKTKENRTNMFIGELEHVLFHLCNPNFHIALVRNHSLHFYAAHKEILNSTLIELSAHKDAFGANKWLDVLKQIDNILLLEKFWKWFGDRKKVKIVFQNILDFGVRFKSKIKNLIREDINVFSSEYSFDFNKASEKILGFKELYVDSDSSVVVYRLNENIIKVVRLCSSGKLDSMSSEAACFSSYYDDVRTDIFYDHGSFISGWIDRLKAYSKDNSLALIEKRLISSNFYEVNTAIDELRNRLSNKQRNHELLRILYSALYYRNNYDTGICRSISLRVNKILEDVLTERPVEFPPSRINRSISRGERAYVCITTFKSHGVSREKIQARVVWSVNGHRKKPIAMKSDTITICSDSITFKTELPIGQDWIHYSVQISNDNGKTWEYEKFDTYSNGILKFVPDERGQRILSFYTDTLNLKLDHDMQPLRNHTGSFVYGTFDDISEQLKAIRDEGYTRIYPLGALELGWAGEAGPDPSVFSIWDGKTVRRDMGGIEGLIRLKEKADSLNMKVVLDVVSHFSRANYAYAYSLPAYIIDHSGKLSRRAGWDGISDEWFDSFMVNMRDYNNIEILTDIYKELAGLGFGLRIDVGHGFDSVFPVDQRTTFSARLFGDVVTGGADRVDLRGTWESCAAILGICYEVQKAIPEALVVYSEQWHANEVRMIKSGTFPYNSFIKNLEAIRDGQDVHSAYGLNDTIIYLNKVYQECGGQTLSFFNTHDEESPPSNYQNMIWPAAALLVFSSNGPLLYHISRLPSEEEAGTIRERFNTAYTECWKHWTFNRWLHPWNMEKKASQKLLSDYPLLRGFGTYLRGLYKFADENPALTKGTIKPIQTNNGRIAAFFRSYKNQHFLCVFNFPNPQYEGQQAISREFNFELREAPSCKSIPFIETDETYEFVERYNNAEGKTRRGKREYWSGEELLNLGFGGILSPVSSHVYEIIYRDHSLSEEYMIPDSFLRYRRYGKEYRVRHSYIARVFAKACEQDKGGFERFSALFEMTVTWILKFQLLDTAELSMVLAEISENNKRMRDTIIEFLIRIAANEKGNIRKDIQLAAVDILQSINIGTIVLISPESKYSGSSGGVGIYTTDIADVLSELGFHVVIVTALYEWNRNWIMTNYHPKYEGHCFTVTFPAFDNNSQSIGWEEHPNIVNILRSRAKRHPHGKKVKIDVLYLENDKYLETPYGGLTSEDKLRRARIFSQGAIEALRCYNYYPSIIQTNEWPTWLVPAYLERWQEYKNDPHFKGTKVGSMMHNPHPSYGITLNEANPIKRNYYCLVMGLNPEFHYDLAVNLDSHSGHEIDLMHTMLKSSQFVGTVSKAMKQRVLDEPWVFGHAHDFKEKEAAGRFFARRNGFNMASRQKLWFGTRKSMLETYLPSARRRLFIKYTNIKKIAKIRLQSDSRISLEQDNENSDHIIFSMLHRICKQKGFELLVDWKVYIKGGQRYIKHEPWNMDGITVLEYFLSTDRRIQYIICGRVEDSFDGRRFDMHFKRIAGFPKYKGQFAYYPEGSLPPSLYRDVYIGSQFFVMPSGGEVGEPCGISQQEAHAGGTPVIAHDQDGLKSTVSDRLFGDTKYPSNGIKFKGYTGEALLDALLDAVEVYYKNRRLRYLDDKGRSQKEQYSDLSYNALHTDHRWLRLLRDYVDMYATVLGVKLPRYLDAVRLIAAMASAKNDDMCNTVLRQAFSMVEAVNYLTDVLFCEIPSLQNAASQVMLRLDKILPDEGRIDIEGRLRQAKASPNKKTNETAISYLPYLRK